MNITVFGAGPIGLITSLSLIKFGHTVLCVDINTELIQNLSKGLVDLHETGLQAELESALENKKMTLTSDLNNLKPSTSSIYFAAVGTPSHSNGECNLTYIQNCVQKISEIDQPKKIIVIKSTVPPGTHQFLSEKHTNCTFVSCPEFLREGTALYDALNPDRLIIGSHDSAATEVLLELFKPLIQKTKVIITDPTSAELAKYGSNIFLAARVSLINELSRFAEAFNADIKSVSEIIGSDHRIGPDFLNAGAGYGGSCFPKDISALIHLAEQKKIDSPLIQSIQTTNILQHDTFFKLINENCTEKRIAVWGLSFKPHTNDLREASSIKIIHQLLNEDFIIHVHDPVALPEFCELFKNEINSKKIIPFANKEDCLKSMNFLVLCTEWPEYTQYESFNKNLCVFDGRNTFSPQKMKSLGVKYFSIGQKK